MSKGSARRPADDGCDDFDDRWETIFKREKKNDGVMKHHRADRKREKNEAED